MKKIIIYSIIALIAVSVALIYKEKYMNFYKDRACEILSKEEFLETYGQYNKYYQAKPQKPIYAFVKFEFEHFLEEGVEMFVIGSHFNSSKALPYRGMAESHIRLAFDKPDKKDSHTIGYAIEDRRTIEFFIQTRLTIMLFDKKRNAMCVYAYPSGMLLPNFKGGNKFLFKMTDPHDSETMNTIAVEHLADKQ